MAPLLAFVFAMAVSAGLGGINGLIVNRTGIPSFIATLGTMLAFRGHSPGHRRRGLCPLYR